MRCIFILLDAPFFFSFLFFFKSALVKSGNQTPHPDSGQCLASDVNKLTVTSSTGFNFFVFTSLVVQKGGSKANCLT